MGGGAREKASDFCEKVEITVWYTKVVQLFAARPREIPSRAGWRMAVRPRLLRSCEAKLDFLLRRAG